MAISAIMGALSTASTALSGGVFLGGFLLGAGAAGTLFTHFLVSTAMGAALNALSPKPNLGGATRGYSIAGESGSALDHQIIYGRTRVGGVRIYDASTGANNLYLHRILAFAGHEIESYDEIYLNDELITFGDTYRYTVESVKNVYNERGQVINTTTVVETLGGTNGVGVNESVGSITFSVYKSLGGPIIEADWVSGSITAKTTVLSDTIVSPDRFLGVVKINRHYGTDDQLADEDLIEDTADLEEGRWTSDHKLSGIAYLYIRFQYDQNAFPNGLPSVSATIKGRKVYNPATTLTAWSDNPALCLRDYVTSDFGLDQPASRVDDTLVTEAATICDELVGSDKRYTCNGAFTTGFQPSQVISDMLSSMGGLFWYSQGKWRMKAAKYVAPTISLDESDLRSGISLSTRHSRRSNFNKVKGTFRGDESIWQVADYPPVTEPEFLAADNGIESVADVPLPFTTDSKTAQRLANIFLRRNREQLTFSASFGLKAFQVQVGDFVAINNSRFGWVNKTFEVTNWSFGLTEGLDLQVQMTLREISPAVFTLRDPAIFELNNSQLPNPYSISDVGVALSGELRVVNEQVLGVLMVDLSYDETSTDYVQVQYKPSDSDVWRNLGRVEDSRAEAIGVNDGFYDVRARPTNFLGIRGNWTEVLNQQISLFREPPQDVTEFSANVVNNSLHLTWEPVADLDLSHYRIRYSESTSGATFSNAVDVVQKVARPGNSVVVPAQTGTYFIRAYDKLGIGSLNPTSTVVVTDPSNIQNLNVIATVTESPTFSGSKVFTAVSDVNGTPALVLNTKLLFDEVTTNFDDEEGLFDGGNTSYTGGLSGVEAKGWYVFDQSIDLGAKYTSRVRVSLDTVRVDYVETFDTQAGTFDLKEGLFDGDPSKYDETSVRTQVSYTNDNPAGSPVWSEWQDFIVGDITARAIRFRVVLTTTTPSSSPAITRLVARVDMPDRVISGQDITFTGSTTVNFSPAFRATPAIGLSLANMLSGQRYAITSKSASGFTVTVYDSGGAVATNSVTLDYVAKGYGKVL